MASVVASAPRCRFPHRYPTGGRTPGRSPIIDGCLGVIHHLFHGDNRRDRPIDAGTVSRECPPILPSRPTKAASTRRALPPPASAVRLQLATRVYHFRRHVKPVTIPQRSALRVVPRNCARDGRRVRRSEGRRGWRSGNANGRDGRGRSRTGRRPSARSRNRVLSDAVGRVAARGNCRDAPAPRPTPVRRRWFHERSPSGLGYGSRRLGSCQGWSGNRSPAIPTTAAPRAAPCRRNGIG